MERQQIAGESVGRAVGSPALTRRPGVPRCGRCDDQRWRGWAHDRANWGHFPGAREAMMWIHFPFNCPGERFVREGSHWYPAAYARLLAAAGEEVSGFEVDGVAA